MKALGIALVILALVLAVLPAGAEQRCTRRGTLGDDDITGSQSRDVICLLKGDDYTIGGGGADILKGFPGSDTIVGGSGSDELRGGRGNDHLFATDGFGSDTLNGRLGFDRCFGDVGDTFLNCESIVRVD